MYMSILVLREERFVDVQVIKTMKTTKRNRKIALIWSNEDNKSIAACKVVNGVSCNLRSFHDL